MELIKEGKLKGYGLFGVIKMDSVLSIVPPKEGADPYMVTISKEGNMQCSCPSGVHRGRCKHIDFVRERLGEK